MMSFEKIPPYTAGLSPQQKQEDVFKLSSNENPFCASLSAKKILTEAYSSLHLYPDSSSLPLREELARGHDLKDARQIVCGNGSDELLTYLAMMHLERGEEGLIFEKSFPIYQRSILLARGKVASSARKKTHIPCFETLLSKITEKSKIIFLPVPDNPTGYAPDQETLKTWLERVPPHVLCVIDGAYMDYLPADGAESMTTMLKNLVEERDNIVMMRTFSKAYGLASLRVGWCYGPVKIMNLLDRIRPPFNLSTPAQRVARAILQDHDWLQKVVWHNATWRSWLEGFFKAHGIWFIPSSANFLFFGASSRCDDQQWAERVFHTLLENGISVRYLGHYGFPGALRVSVGSEKGCLRFADVMKPLLKKVLSS